jgi:hypothetical protein
VSPNGGIVARLLGVQIAPLPVSQFEINRTKK